jgi:hypothetical protein
MSTWKLQQFLLVPLMTPKTTSLISFHCNDDQKEEKEEPKQSSIVCVTEDWIQRVDVFEKCQILSLLYYMTPYGSV